LAQYTLNNVEESSVTWHFLNTPNSNINEFASRTAILCTKHHKWQMELYFKSDSGSCMYL